MGSVSSSSRNLGSEKDSKQRSVVIVGAPIGYGQDWLNGVECCPQVIRNSGLINVLKRSNISIEDLGDIPITNESTDAYDNSHNSTLQDSKMYSHKDIKNCKAIGETLQLLHSAILPKAMEKKFILTLGGDHSVATATIAAVKQARKNLAVVWVDAHGDCNTPETSPSKNYHGMPAAHALGWFKKRAPGFEWLSEYLRDPLQECKLAYIGLRDIDPREAELLRLSKVLRYTMRDVDRMGMPALMEEIIGKIAPKGSNTSIHLSFDIDAMDPEIAPGTGTKARGGLSYREGCYICHRLAESGKLVSMDLVEINPSVDVESLHLIDTPISSYPQGTENNSLPITSQQPHNGEVKKRTGRKSCSCSDSSAGVPPPPTERHLQNPSVVLKPSKENAIESSSDAKISGQPGVAGTTSSSVAGSTASLLTLQHALTFHGDNPLVTGTMTVRLGIVLAETALGKTII